MALRIGLFILLVAALAGGCGGDAGNDAVTADEAAGDAGSDADDSEVVAPAGDDDNGPVELYPDVIGATASRADDGTWTVSATLSSPYDSPERYADAWRVLGPDGEVYGTRELAHDHAAEQPFTRSQTGIEIPDGVTVVTIEGRDQVSGWGGATFELDLAP